MNKMVLPHLISQGISLLDGQEPNNLSGAFTEFLQSRGVNMNEIWSPGVDVAEDSNTIYVYVNIPGVKTESIDVDFFNNRVDIKGERKRPFSEDTTVRKNEIIYGRFERKITLPISVTARESVSINAENGVLVIKVDKAREERNRFSVRIPTAGVSTSGNAEVKLENEEVSVD